MGWVKDKDREKFAVEFFNQLKLSGDFAGVPFKLRPWQEQIVTDLLAVVDEQTDKRRYKEAFIALPKKNGKTQIIAGLVLLFLFTAKSGRQIYSAASTREQSGLIYKDIADMVRQNSHLSKEFRPLDSKKRIVHQPSGSFYQSLSADVGPSDGIKPNVVIYDELHRAPNRDLYDLLSKSMPNVNQPLFITITTAGDDKSSICYEQWEYARKVKKGLVTNEKYYAVLYEPEEGDDWADPKTWYKCNPALGDFMHEEFIKGEYQKAIDSPSTKNSFLRYHLNVWTERECTYLNMDKWDANSRPVDAEALKGKLCFGAIDLASAQDLSAIGLIFPNEDKTYSVLPRFFIPADTARHWEDRDKVSYSAWVEKGYIIETPGAVIEYATVMKEILRLAKEYRVKQWAIDRYDATMPIQTLQAEGIEPYRFPQSFIGMSGPTKELERLVIDGRLNHGGNPVLRWNMSNVVVDTDTNGNIRPSKKKSRNKIDGAVCLIMALALALDNQSQPLQQKSVYESRGILTL